MRSSASGLTGQYTSIHKLVAIVKLVTPMRKKQLGDENGELADRWT